jgi:hypothetical protein
LRYRILHLLCFLCLALLAVLRPAHAAVCDTPCDDPNSANIQFDTAFTFNFVSNIDYASVKSATAGDYTINTTGTLSAANGGVLITGTPTVGQVTIIGSSTQAITISISGTTADQGVSVTATRGRYGAGAEQNFPISGGPPGAGGTNLFIGATVHADGTQADSVTANPVITIQAIYQ